MDSSYSEHILHWIARLEQHGWLDKDQLEALTATGHGTPTALFSTEHRPLVVAFFGGTGVGKSTLLNRLAGETVAKTGIERPTSREVTVYLHHTLPLDRIQTQLPWERVEIAHHHNDNRRNVVWIDMPDIDSVEQSNRELVLRCIPHIDVLIYVVSPERYRDDSGWHLLLEHAQNHAWLFVMNQWDLGDEVQIEDFVSLLRQGGFADPLVIRCDSQQDLEKRGPDDFGKLEEIISRLEKSGGVAQLEVHQQQLQQQKMQQQVREVLQIIGEPGKVDRLATQWKKLWKQTLTRVEPSIQWSVQSLAMEYAGKKQQRNSAGDDLFLDLWAREHLTDTLDRLAMEASTSNLPVTPLKQRLDPYRNRIEDIVQEQVHRSLRQSLAKPGRGWQRAMLWLFGMLRYLLPLGASGWVAWQVVTGYYRGFQGDGNYLGVNFAIHSLLLIGLAWLIPFLIHRLLQPSVEKKAAAGIRQGYREGLERIDREVLEILASLKEELTALSEEGKKLLQQCQTGPVSLKSSGDPLLERMMIEGDKRSQ